MPTSRLPRSLSISPAAQYWLDFMRGFSAIIVLLAHWRASLFVPYGEVADKGRLISAFYFVTGMGHYAVLSFFILSGYLISLSIFRSLAGDRWSWREYFVQRLARLWIVIIPGLFLTVFLDRLGIALFGATAKPYIEVHTLHLNAGLNALERLTWPTFLGNVFFLQRLITPTLGTNGALWSLSCEFWYYVLFPILLFGFFERRWSVKLGLWMGAGGVCYLLWGEPLRLFFIWMMGVAIHYIKPAQTRKARVFFGVLGILITVGFAALGKIKLPLVASDILVGVGITLIILSFLKSPISNFKSSVAVKTVAGFSFSLYVIHMPILAFIKAWMGFNGHAQWQPQSQELFYGVGVIFAILLLSYLFSLLTEVHTNRGRQWLRRFFDAFLRIKNFPAANQKRHAEAEGGPQP